MNNYLENGHEILRILMENGYESFLIGPYVRDYVIPQESHETLEIITPSVFETWVGIFGENNVRRVSLRQSVLTFEENHYILSTYRQESKLTTGGINDNNDVLNAARISDNSERFAYELSQRTFTVDALCLDTNGDLKDLYGSYEDISRKCIRLIKDPFKAFDETPMLYLETARLIGVLGFTPDKETWRASRRCAKSCAKILEVKDIIQAMKYILNGPYALAGYTYLVKTKAYKYLTYFGPELLRLYDNTAHPTYDEFVLRIFVSQKEINEEVLASCEESSHVKALFNEIMHNPKSQFDARTICHLGLEDSLLCDSITHLIYETPLHTGHIKHIHHKLKLKKEDSFVINEKDCLNLINNVNVNPKISAHELYEILLNMVMVGTIKNETKVVSDKALKLIIQYAHDNANKNNVLKKDVIIHSTLDSQLEAAPKDESENNSSSQGLVMEENQGLESTNIQEETDEEWIERTAQGILDELKANGFEITDEIKAEAYEKAKGSVLKVKEEKGGSL